MITAMLEGVLDRVRLAETDPTKSGVRPGPDGRPPSGFGGDLYYGVYFGGCQGKGQQAEERVYSACIDLTMNLQKVPDKKRGNVALQTGQLLDRASELVRYLMKDFVVPNAANTHRGADPKGKFCEPFDRYTISPARRADGEWFGEDCSPDCPPSGFIVTVSLHGLLWIELETELPT